MCSNRSAGFTLIELIVLIVVVAVALAGVLLMYSNSLRGSADPVATKQALAAAEALLEEIQLTAFCNPSGGNTDPTTQANRQNFDDVSQYAGFTTTGIYTIDGGAPIAGLERYDVVSVTVVDAAFGGIVATDSKLITVTVTGPTNLPNAATVAHAGYRMDYAGTCP